MRKHRATPLLRRSDTTKGYPPARERLLAAALREFGENGFAGARVDKITREANANKQLLYHYFGNKEALFKNVLELAYREYSGNALRLAISNLDAKTSLRRFIDQMFRPSSATIYFNQILQDENRFGAKHVKLLPSVKQTYVEVIKLVQSILSKGVAEGVFRSDIDPREFYISLVGMFNLRTVNAKTLGAAIGVPLETDAGMARSRAAAFDLILHGISSRGGSDQPRPKKSPRRCGANGRRSGRVEN
jgi:TetR/AcrR family transcriptional regulator